MTRSVIDPITRIEGHLRVEMEVTNGKVSDAWVSGGCFRGMELVVEGRTPEDAAQIVQRICGVCPVSHSHASTIAAEKAYGIEISNNARIIRNLIEGAQFLHSHILWFYNLAALDYVNPLNALDADVADAYALAQEANTSMNSDLGALKERLKKFADNGQLSIFSGNWFDAEDGTGYKLPPELDLICTAHYLEALKMQAKASEVAALLGGKMPHVMTVIPGGTSFVPTEQKLDDLKYLVDEIYDWVESTMIPDTLAIAPAYKDALEWGKGCGRYIAWGVFENQSMEMNDRYLPAGVLDDGLKISDVEESKITEYMGHSWYKGEETHTSPYFITEPEFTSYDVNDRYSWIKCPAYDGKPYEAGGLLPHPRGLQAQRAVRRGAGQRAARGPRRARQRGRRPVDARPHRRAPDRVALHRRPHEGMGGRARRGREGRRQRVLPQARHHHGFGHGLLGGPARRPLPQREGGRRQDRRLPDHHSHHVERRPAQCQRGERTHGGSLDRRAGGRHREAHQRPAHRAQLRPVHRLRRACDRAGDGQELRDRHAAPGG